MKLSRLLPLFVLVPISLLAQPQEEPNTLSPPEEAQGWILLWDGHSLDNWTPELVSTWKTSEGFLTAGPSPYFWLRKDTQFSDFVLKAEFRMLSAEADSGIFIRAAREGDPSRTGYQININNVNQEYGTGSVVYKVKYNASPVSPNEWHQYVITAEGDHITAVLDGKKTVDFHDDTSAGGYIGLQFLKGEDVEFRNLKLLRLRPPQQAQH